MYPFEGRLALNMKKIVILTETSFDKTLNNFEHTISAHPSLSSQSCFKLVCYATSLVINCIINPQHFSISNCNAYTYLLLTYGKFCHMLSLFFFSRASNDAARTSSPSHFTSRKLHPSFENVSRKEVKSTEVSLFSCLRFRKRSTRQPEFCHQQGGVHKDHIQHPAEKELTAGAPQLEKYPPGFLRATKAICRSESCTEFCQWNDCAGV